MLIHTPRIILVTGGCGFIGSNYIRRTLANDSSTLVINLDLLTYAGNIENLRDIEKSNRYVFVKGNITNAVLVKWIFDEYAPDTVIHFAAESHVDRSISSPSKFIETNIMGTYNLLSVAHSAWGKRKDVRFHAISTDEVFGSLGDDGFFVETSQYNPSSPYSASKASADHLVRAWHQTYNLPITISNCSNNYGPYQHPEKLIPLTINRAYKNLELPVYGNGRNVRDWLHVDDHCDAINAIIRHADVGETFLISGRNEWKNIDVVNLICDSIDSIDPKTNARRENITFVSDRPGHDYRYAIDPSHIKNVLGWEPKYTFKKGIQETIQWYVENASWIEKVTKE